MPAGPLGSRLPALGGRSLPWRETTLLRTCLRLNLKVEIALMQRPWFKTSAETLCVLLKIQSGLSLSLILDCCQLDLAATMYEERGLL